MVLVDCFASKQVCVFISGLNDVSKRDNKLRKLIQHSQGKTNQQVDRLRSQISLCAKNLPAMQASSEHATGMVRCLCFVRRQNNITVWYSILPDPLDMWRSAFLLHLSQSWSRRHEEEAEMSATVHKFPRWLTSDSCSRGRWLLNGVKLQWRGFCNADAPSAFARPNCTAKGCDSHTCTSLHVWLTFKLSFETLRWHACVKAGEPYACCKFSKSICYAASKGTCTRARILHSSSFFYIFFKLGKTQVVGRGARIMWGSECANQHFWVCKRQREKITAKDFKFAKDIKSNFCFLLFFQVLHARKEHAILPVFYGWAPATFWFLAWNPRNRTWLSQIQSLQILCIHTVTFSTFLYKSVH